MTSLLHDVVTALRGLRARPGYVVATVLCLALAWGVTRVLASVLYGVSPSDPLVFLSVAALLGGIATLASWLPARRAARVDATTALRAE
ncbi:MAG TPA: hypothetical protein VHQ45_13885 [Gemmatimonadaceae bacterium]|nr:hypothetical protein [Gemmatimonadaceae bacterium]